MLSPDGRWVAVTARTLARARDRPGLRGRRRRGDRGSTAGGRRRGLRTAESIVYRADGDLFVAEVGSNSGRRITRDERRRARAGLLSRRPHDRVLLRPARARRTSGACPHRRRRAGAGHATAPCPSMIPRFAPAWSPDGAPRSPTSRTPTTTGPTIIFLIDVATGSSRRLSSDLMASSTAVWSPSGDTVALLGTSKARVLVRGPRLHLPRGPEDRHGAERWRCRSTRPTGSTTTDCSGRPTGPGSTSSITSAAT